MAIFLGIVTVVIAFSVFPLVYIIFHWTMKEKTYDERIAEQRKQLAMEHNMKTKLKHQQSKKTSKKIDKERPHQDKKNKVVSWHNGAGKEIKKTDTSKNSVSSSVDKTDGIAVSVPKKKVDKVQPKNVNSLCSKISVDATEDHRGDNNNNCNRCENNDLPTATDESAHNIDSVTSNASSNSIDNENSSSGGTSKNGSGDNANYNGSSNDSESGGSSIEKNVNKFKYSQMSTVSDVGDAQKGKVNSADLHDKAASKKQIVKQDGEGVGKASPKADERTAKDTKTLSKQKIEEKLTGKIEEEKTPKDYKPLASPSKVKKSAEGGWKAGEVTNADSYVSNNNGQEEAKSKPDVKKENEVAGAGAESVVEKEEFCSVGKSDKSPLLVASRKPNGSVNAGSSAGKTSPVQSVKNQRQMNNTKTVKKQTTEIKNLQKLSNYNNGPVNVTLLIQLIANADLSKSEIQNLIDLLLNKLQENGTVDAEWIGSGRQDPVVKLKKQLAEKEKALAAEQEAHQAIQNKVKELRAELNIEKHANRQREEILNSRQSDVQTLSVRLQAVSDEKQTLAKQIQQLQAKLNEERLIIRSLKEENSKTKSSLQQELLSQRQQLEMHIAHLNEQHSQAIMTLETQLGQLAGRLQEQETTSAQINEENVMFRDRIAVQENQIAHYNQTHSSATQELVIQLEDLRTINSVLERDLNNSQFEVTRIGSELKSATEQLNRQNAEIDKFNRIVQNERIEIDELLKENARLNDQSNITFSEKTQLKMENEKLKNELIELQEQARDVDELDRLESEITSYRNAVIEKNQEIARLNGLVAQLEMSSKQYLSQGAELEEQSKIVDELKESLKKQLEKNNDLRSKNWKAMEALSNMEKTLETKMKGIPCASHVKMKERHEVLQRMKIALPTVSETGLNSPASLEDNVWFDYMDKVFSELGRSKLIEHQPEFTPQSEENIVPKDANVLVLDELEKQNRQLQTMVSHYKSIISETEGMLNSLQKHVEQEEKSWSEQNQILESQLNAVTEELNNLRILVDKAKVVNGCVENDSSNDEQKLNNRVNKCLPSLSNSSINDTHVSS